MSMCKSCGCHGAPLNKETIQVEGMTCNHCKSSVEKAVRGLPGVLAAEVDLAAKKLTVEYDSKKSSVDDIKKTVEDIGFDVA